MYSPELYAQASHLLEMAAIRGLMIATAESCTGGLIGGLLTEVPGSSIAVERGFIVYSNLAKQELLGVPAGLIAEHGAVSREVAMAMAAGAVSRSAADIAVAVTGIAGPTGGSPDKPIGLVHIAVKGPGNIAQHKEWRYGNLGRKTVRQRTVEDAMDMVLAVIKALPARDHAEA